MKLWSKLGIFYFQLQKGTSATRQYDEHKLSTSSAGSGDPMTPITPITPTAFNAHCLPCFSDVRLNDLKVSAS